MRPFDDGMSPLNHDFPQYNFQSSVLPGNLLSYSTQPTIHVHHNGNRHFVASSSIAGKFVIYDSLIPHSHQNLSCLKSGLDYS